MNINLTMLGQMIMFAMFVWFCMKLVWPPIVVAMNERKKRIEDGLLAAEKGVAAEKAAHHNAQQIIEQNKSQAADIIANANKQATKMVEDAKNVATKEADRIKTNAYANTEQEAVRVRNELKQQVSSLVMQGVTAVLEKEVDAKEHKDMLGKLAQTL